MSRTKFRHALIQSLLCRPPDWMRSFRSRIYRDVEDVEGCARIRSAFVARSGIGQMRIAVAAFRLRLMRASISRGAGANCREHKFARITSRGPNQLCLAATLIIHEGELPLLGVRRNPDDAGLRLCSRQAVQVAAQVVIGA